MAQTPILYLLGGPMRTGKTLISRPFNAATGVSVVSTDDIVHMLAKGLPQIGIDRFGLETWKPVASRQAHTAPFVEAFAENRFEEQRPVLIEGELEPESVRRLIERFGPVTRACFMGDIATTAETKAALLRSYDDVTPAGWLKDEPDAYLLDIATQVLELSAAYREAATTMDVPFFDMQPDFETGAEAVLAYLVGADNA